MSTRTRAPANGPRAGSRLIALANVGEGASSEIEAVLKSTPLAAVILTGAVEECARDSRLSALVGLVQRYDAAALVEDDGGVARALGADGVHLSAGADTLARYRAARSLLGPGASIGAAVFGSRHLAMEIGEAGADYVAFAPDPSEPDLSAALAGRDDLIGWWGEVMEVPCVALGCHARGEADTLTALGADFVVLPVRALTDA